MSNKSRFYQLTDKLLLEYISSKNDVDSSSSQPNRPVYVYMGKDSMQYVMLPENMLHWSLPNETHTTYHYVGHGIIDEVSLDIPSTEPATINDLKNELVRKESSNTFHIVDNTNYLNFDSSGADELVGSTMTMNYDKCCILLKDKTGHDGVIDLDEESSENNVNRSGIFHFDKIRVHILQGYTFNDIGGFMLQIRAKITDVYRDLDKEILDAAINAGIDIDDPVAFANFKQQYLKENKQVPVSKHVHDYLTLLDYFMPKEMVKDEIIWQLNNPLYINSKFFDRYIEINVPSSYDLGKRLIDGSLANKSANIYSIYEDSQYNKVYYGSPDTSANVVIRFASVKSENIQYKNYEQNLVRDYECTYTIDPITEFTFKYDSSADNFNAQIELDPDNQKIYYYPTYRVGETDLPISIAIMQGIEQNIYPMFDYAEYDDMNQGLDAFLETYGENAFTWIIINELSVTYNYSRIIDNDHDATTDEYSYYTYTDYFTNTIDYTGKTENNGDFWKEQFLPNLKTITNFTCNTITLKYTVHLYNRLNNRDIMRTATMNIPVDMYARTHINVNNVIEYKVVNKMVKSAGSTIVKKDSDNASKLTKHYYDVTQVVVSNGNNNYPQGKYTLYLNHTSSNYMFKLFNKTDNNVNVPFDLSGPYNYQLKFPTTNIGEYITLKPHKDAENYNPQMGQLIFYISDTNVRKIMAVPESDRFFSIVINQNDSSIESTLYEGKVAYFNR